MIISLTSAVSLFRASLLCHAFSSCLGSIGMPDSNFICLIKQTMVQERRIGQPLVHTSMVQPVSTSRTDGLHIGMLLLLLLLLLLCRGCTVRNILRAGSFFYKEVWDNEKLTVFSTIGTSSKDGREERGTRIYYKLSLYLSLNIKSYMSTYYMEK